MTKNDEVEVDEPEFFKDGFREEEGVPRFLREVAKEALECGKAVHLLKTLAPGEEWFEEGSEWPTFAALASGRMNVVVGEEEQPVEVELDPMMIARQALLPTLARSASAIEEPPPRRDPSAITSFSQSITEAIADLCTPLFQVVHYKLHRLICDNCRIEYHLTAIQGVFLMRKGWEVGSFLNGLFEKVNLAPG